ncbi:MAG: cobalamin-dependent protein [Desulfobacteraceae bacterium]|jgi:methylmalonyl-CoA mutase C-terminal domain/subunit|nr:cobalamin-dependent protein [Desulfobacteraceae bacterium]
MGNNRKIRILIAKAGCDIHERGPYTLMTAFRDAGMEVIYTGRYQSSEAIAKVALVEDVDIIALSDHTGSLPIIAEGVLKALEKLGAVDIRVTAGGLITPQDVKELEAMGVSGNFGPGTPLDVIIRHTVGLARK